MGFVVEVYYNAKLPGEVLVTPLKSYHKFMVNASDDLYGWKKTVLNAIHIATGIFAYPTFALIAALGMVIKFVARCCTRPKPVDFDHLIIQGVGQDQIDDCESSDKELKNFLQVLITNSELFEVCKRGHLFPRLFLIIHGWIQKGALKYDEENSILKQFVDHIKTTGDFEGFATSVQDFEILTKDGYRYRTNRAVLRMTSEYFVRLMDSGFAEAQALGEEDNRPLLAPSQVAQAQPDQALDAKELLPVQPQSKSLKLDLSSSVVKHYLHFIHTGELHPASLSEADGYVLADFGRQTFVNNLASHVAERLAGRPSQCRDLVSLSKFLTRIWKSYGKVEVTYSDSERNRRLIVEAFSCFFKNQYGVSFQLAEDRFTIPSTALNLLRNYGCIGAYLRAYVNCISFMDILSERSPEQLTAAGLPADFWSKIKTIAFGPNVRMYACSPDAFGTHIQKIRTLMPNSSRILFSLEQINSRASWTYSDFFTSIKQQNQGLEIAVSLCDYASARIEKDRFCDLSNSDFANIDRIENLTKFTCLRNTVITGYDFPSDNEIRQFVQRLMTKTGQRITNVSDFIMHDYDRYRRFS